MVVNIGRFTQLPCLFKPLMFILLFVLFILYAVCFWVSWWSWFTVVIQIVVVIALIAGLVMEVDSRMMNIWLFLEMIVSILFTIWGILNIILHLRWLIVIHGALYGVQSIMIVGLTALYCLNFLMIFKIWRNMGASTTTTAPPMGVGIQPGNTGSMHPGFGSTPAMPPRPAPPPAGYPVAVYPGGNQAYPSAVPPGATFPTTGQQPTTYNSAGPTNY